MLAARRRFRLLIWLDESHGPVQAAIATYVGDDKLTESTFDCGPFDAIGEVADVALRTLDRQLTLWPTG